MSIDNEVGKLSEERLKEVKAAGDIWTLYGILQEVVYYRCSKIEQILNTQEQADKEIEYQLSNDYNLKWHRDKIDTIKSWKGKTIEDLKKQYDDWTIIVRKGFFDK